ncbi:hypothetical protein O9H85_21360 [Paenibacillus filicis]|uniref:Uncharacterized protein n=1 Tax=Paenibacillus gyeongsangnamensis TaxID=3388067 RepID=A0ABT4QDI4_9BACL|nr:hypothetical protein [Paenibacillus filicis]MCZ8514923.1 hypothetical protein [Paenibacillus filicis]
MNSKDTQIVETITGSWLRFPNSFKKFHCLVELPNELSLNINMKSGAVHVHKIDTNNVYQPYGELVVGSVNHQLHCSVIPHSLNETGVTPHAKSDAS